MTTATNQLPPCPLPDCTGGEHHYHNRYHHDVENSSCKISSEFHTRCYGPHQPQQQWQPIEHDQIKAGMVLKRTDRYGGYTVFTVKHVETYGDKYLRVRGTNGFYVDLTDDGFTWEVDPATIPADPDADLIEKLVRLLDLTDSEDAREAIAAIRAHDEGAQA